jgi:hypothetical protein
MPAHISENLPPLKTRVYALARRASHSVFVTSNRFVEHGAARSAGSPAQGALVTKSHFSITRRERSFKYSARRSKADPGIQKFHIPWRLDGLAHRIRCPQSARQVSNILAQAGWRHLIVRNQRAIYGGRFCVHRPNVIVADNIPYNGERLARLSFRLPYRRSGRTYGFDSITIEVVRVQFGKLRRISRSDSSV